MQCVIMSAQLLKHSSMKMLKFIYLAQPLTLYAGRTENHFRGGKFIVAKTLHILSGFIQNILCFQTSFSVTWWLTEQVMLVGRRVGGLKRLKQRENGLKCIRITTLVVAFRDLTYRRIYSTYEDRVNLCIRVYPCKLGLVRKVT